MKENICEGKSMASFRKWKEAMWPEHGERVGEGGWMNKRDFLLFSSFSLTTTIECLMRDGAFLPIWKPAGLSSDRVGLALG